MTTVPRPRHGPPGENIDQSPAMARVVDRNISALVTQRDTRQQRREIQDRLAEWITKFTGSMTFVYLHLLLFGGWIVVNLGWTPLPQFDPSFVVLAMAASVEAIFLSTFVLITQNRMAELADRRAELDLQVSLLAEHEITRLIRLTGAIASHLGLDEAQDPDLAELRQDVQPERVLDQIESIEQQTAERNGS